MSSITTLPLRNRLASPLALLALAVPALGDVTTWTGAVDSAWDDAANWDAGVPDSALDAHVVPSSNDPSTAGVAAPQCARLIVESGAALTIGALSPLEASAGASISGLVTGTGALRLVGDGALDVPPPGPTLEVRIVIDGGHVTLSSVVKLDDLDLLSGTLETLPGTEVRASGRSRFLGGELLGAGMLDLNGDVLFQGTSVVTPPDMSISGSLVVNDAFAPTTGLVALDGFGPRTLAAANGASTAKFFDLLIATSSTVTTPADVHVARNFVANGFLSISGALDVDGDMSGDGGLALSTGGGNFGGNFTFHGGLSGGGMMVFDGGGDGLFIETSTELPTVDFRLSSGMTIQGSSLTVAGDFNLESGELVIAAGNRTSVSGAANFLAGMLTGPGVLDVEGDVIFAGTAVAAGPDFEVAGNWTADGGYAPTAGIVTLDGTLQTMAPDGAALASLFAELVIAPNTAVTTTAGVSVAGRITIDGSLSMGGPLDVDGDTEGGGGLALSSSGGNFGGNFTFHGGLSSGGMMVFDGGGDGLFIETTTPLPNAEIEVGSKMSVLGANLTVDGALTLTSGEFALGAGNVTAVNGAATFQGGILAGEGELVIANGTLNIQSPGVVVLDGTGLVIDGDLNLGQGQLEVAPGSTTEIFGSGLFAGGTVSGTGRLDLAGDVTFSGAMVSESPEIELAGDWVSDGSYAPSTGRVTFDGATPQSISAAGSDLGTVQFPDLVIQAGADVTAIDGLFVAGDADVNGSLTATAAVDVDGDMTGDGGLALSTGGGNFGGNFTFHGNLSSGGMMVFDGGGDGLILQSTSDFPTVDFVLGGSMTVQGAALFVDGSFNLLSGDLTVATGNRTTVTGSALFTGGSLSGVGTLDVGGDILFANTEVGGSPDIELEGNWSSSDGYAPTEGRVTFDGTTPQSINGVGTNVGTVQFPDLVIAAGADVTANDELAVGGDLDINGSLTATGSMDVEGDAAGDGSFALSTGGGNFGGNFTFHGNLSSGGMMVFDGGGGGLILQSTSDFPTVDFALGGSMTIQGAALSVNGDFELISGDLTVAAGNRTTVTGSANFGAGSLSGAGTLDIAGDVTFDGTLTTNSPNFELEGDWSSDESYAPTSGRVTFDGTTAQTISGAAANVGTVQLPDLVIALGADVTANDGLSVAGDIDIDGSLTATGPVDVEGDAAGDGDFALSTGGGNFGGSFRFNGNLSSGGMMVFDGGADGLILQSTSNFPTVDFVLGGSMTIQGAALFVGGDFQLLAGDLTLAPGNRTTVTGAALFTGGQLDGTGTLDTAGSCRFDGALAAGAVSIECGGDWIADEGFAPSGGEVVLDGAGVTQIVPVDPSDGETLPTLSFDRLELRNGERELASSLRLQLTELFAANGATLDLGHQSVEVESGNLEFEGALELVAGGELALGSSVSVAISPNGALTLSGHPDLPTRVIGLDGGGYAFTIAGAIEAMNCVFEEMGPDGIVVEATASLAPAPYDFRAASFDRPADDADSVLLDFRTATPVDLRYANLQDSTATGSFNVRTAPGSSPFTFTNFEGAFAGSDFEDDPNDLIGWNPADETQVADYVAASGLGDVTITWETTSEVDAEAFIVERTAANMGEPSVIAELTPTGPGTYEWVDSEGTPLVAYEYRLLERLSHGALRELGLDVAQARSDSLPANVLTVNPSGGLEAIQIAINLVSSPNTVIWVAEGTYRSFTISDSVPDGLKIVAGNTVEVVVDTNLEPVRITGTDVAQTVHLAGLRITGSNADHPQLVVENCEGLVLLERLDVGPQGAPGLAASAALEVALSDRVVVQSCDAAGAPSLRVLDQSTVIATRGTLTTLEVAGNSHLRTAGLTSAAVVEPGSTLTELPGVMPQLNVPDFVQIGELFAVQLEAAPEQPWVLAAGIGLGWLDLPEPTIELALLVDLGTLSFPASGATDLGGESALDLLLPAVPALSGASVTLQAAAIDTEASTTRFSNARIMVGLP